jgi:hypothetical protein
MSEYLLFELDQRGEKTDRWRVHSTRSYDLLGRIKWFGRWRQYAFFPYQGCVFNRDCLTEIAAFTQQLMDQRKTKRRPVPEEQRA